MPAQQGTPPWESGDIAQTPPWETGDNTQAPQMKTSENVQIPPWESGESASVPSVQTADGGNNVRIINKDDIRMQDPATHKKILHGKKIDQIPVYMKHVTPGEGVVVEGLVVSAEGRVLKEGKWTILEFAVTDYTNTVKCKLFMRGEKLEKANTVKAGMWLRVMGNFEYDDYAKENVISAKSIVSVDKPERMDTAEVARTELHLHTTMSAQDGLTSAKKYINQAKKWGMKSIAITDHGVVQAFPEAVSALNYGGDAFKIIFGMEAYMVNDAEDVYTGKNRTFDDEFVIFDIETTGLSPVDCGITEIGAVRIKGGKIIDEFGTFVDPGHPIPPKITEITGITDEMVAGAPSVDVALREFWNYAGNTCLVAHNASFDTSFVFSYSKKNGIDFECDVMDTLSVARAHIKDIRSHKLNIIAKYYDIPLKHHRAVNDAKATAQILLKIFDELRAKGANDLHEMNRIFIDADAYKRATVHHTILLAKNKTGLTNLYNLVSLGHLNYFYRTPRIPKREIEAHREGLIIGGACERGEVFMSAMNDPGDAKLKEVMEFYDYVEIQPTSNNEFLVRDGRVQSTEHLRDLNRRIYRVAKEMGKMTVATTDTHYLDPEDEYFRRIVMHIKKFKDADNQAPLYFRTTDEMLEEFSYMGEDVAHEVVVGNPNAISDMIEKIELFPGETVMPVVDGDKEYIRELGYSRMHEMYGNPLPELIATRLERELGSVINNGFAVLYYIAQKLVKKSNDDGYLVGSRGSVGSSLAAFALGITEVNPLPPHYLCTKCKHIDFDIDTIKFGCGVDLPPKDCPECKEPMLRDGYDIPFEVFLGLNAEKVPDIDLNFSGEYQSKAHKFVEEFFGKEYVFRAGTIGEIKEKTARGYVLKYMEEKGLNLGRAEVERLAIGISGTKRTTGQHPGGMVIVPHDREVYEFTPIQKPADKLEADTVTTHFDFNSMHDILVKLDILGHDNPTSIRMLQDLTGLEPMEIPLNDPDTMELFCSTKSLGVTKEQINGIAVGTLGIPEFGTFFVRQMLLDTKPKTMSELVRISGLSHGTDVWTGNAQTLIADGVATLGECICTRDDIMNYLVKKGVDHQLAFFTMENVRKGKGLTDKMYDAMVAANVEEWFIDSCKKIKYMFPKAHAVAYVIMSLRIAYCKVHHPLEYYATFFTIKSGDFDSSYFVGGSEAIKKNIKEIEGKGKDAAAVEQNVYDLLLLALEMHERGFEFLPVHVRHSKAMKFIIEDGKIRMPFFSVPKLGEKVAVALEAQQDNLTNVEDLKKNAGLSKTVVDTLRTMGSLQGLPESSQLTLFDL